MSAYSARTRIKFCGLTRHEDITLAAALGVDALGFVMWPKSARSITPALLEELAVQVPAFVTRVGLFVNQPAEFIEQCLPYLDLIQLLWDKPQKHPNKKQQYRQ